MWELKIHSASINSITHNSSFFRRSSSSFVRQTAGWAEMPFCFFYCFFFLFFLFPRTDVRGSATCWCSSSFRWDAACDHWTVQTKKREEEEEAKPKQLKNKDLRAESSNNNYINNNNSTIGTLWSPVWGMVGEECGCTAGRCTQAKPEERSRAFPWLHYRSERFNLTHTSSSLTQSKYTWQKNKQQRVREKSSTTM